jgi:hypothetical protein
VVKLELSGDSIAMVTGFNFRVTFFPWRWGGYSTQAWMPIYVSILHIPQMIWVWRATVEWYWQEKTEELEEKPVPVPLCPPRIPHGLTRVRIRASAVRGRRLMTWAMARPSSNVTRIIDDQSVCCLNALLGIETSDIRTRFKSEIK